MKQYWLIFFFLVVFSFSFGQEYSFNTYSTNEGLSQSQVYDIQQDQNGFIWIATEGGLNKFDGKDFKIYTVEDGLLKDGIRSLYILENKIYIGSKNGICLYNQNGFKQFKFQSEYLKYRVDCIQLFNDTLFVGTNGASLFYLDPEK